MADDTEKIAMVIDTQAQLAGLRNASQGISELANQAKASSEQVRISAAQDAAAWAKADGSVHEYNLEIQRLVQAQRTATAAAAQTMQSTVQTTAATSAAADVVGNKLNPNLRSAALGASRLTLAFDGMGGGVQGVARSIGVLSFGVADLSGPGFAALASGVAAGAIVLATLGDLMYKDAQRATSLGDAFKDHLGNLKFDATVAALDAVHKRIGDIENDVPTLSQRLKVLAELGPGAFTSANDSFLTNLRHELTLTTDADDQFQVKLKEGEALNKRIADETKAMADAVADLNAAYSSSIRSSSARAQELQDQIAGNTFASQRVQLIESEKEQVDEINKKYADYAKNNKALTADQIAQQQIEVTNAQRQLDLGLRLVDVEKAKADAAKAAAVTQATLRVQAAGTGATSDIDGPSATLNKRLLDIDREYTQAVDKEHVNRNIAAAARDAERLRAYRDFNNALLADDRRVQEANARSQEQIATAGSDQDTPDSKRAVAKLRAAADYDKALGVIGVDRDAADDARRARNERADRDYYASIAEAARQSDAIIAASRDDLDPEADDAARRLKVWQNYYDNLGRLGVDQVNLARVTNAQIARLDRDRAQAGLNELKASTAAYQGHAGAVAAIAKGVNDAIRKYEVAVQVVKDVQQAKSQFAAGVADTAIGNFGGAALHFTASGLYAAAAAFGAAEALGASGGSGSAGGGASGGSQSSTFTPSDQNKAGGQTVIFQQVGAFDRNVIAAVAFELGKQDVLKVPLLIPPSFSPITRAA